MTRKSNALWKSTLHDKNVHEMQEYRTLEEHMTAVKGIGLGGIPIGIRQKAAAALRIS